MVRLVRPCLPRSPFAIAATLALFAVACTTGGPAGPLATTPPSSPEATAMAAPSAPVSFTLSSPAFAEGAPIPPEHSCRGADVSPPLTWRGVPSGTTALVLVVDDPDGRDWVHWTILDLPPANGELPPDVAPSDDPPQQGRNDFGRIGYGGPCPPSGTHRYVFRLYALAAPLGLEGSPDGRTVRNALGTATILGQATLTGTFRA